MTEEVLRYISRSIVTYLNGDFRTSYTYANKAIELNEKIEFEKSCIFQVDTIIPKEIKDKLYKLVS